MIVVAVVVAVFAFGMVMGFALCVAAGRADREIEQAREESDAFVFAPEGIGRREQVRSRLSAR